MMKPLHFRGLSTQDSIGQEDRDVRLGKTLLIAAALLPFSTEGDNALAQESGCLPFLDDFTTPWHCQREPFEERIETERHDFTQSATTVGRGVLQIESGYGYFRKENSHEKESSHTTPELTCRLGLTEDIELRLRWNHAWIFIEDEDDRTGSEDIRYGLKLQISRETCSSLLPTSALEIRGSAPTGGEAFTTGRAEVSLDYIYQWSLTERMSLAGSTGFGTNGFGDFGLVPDADTEDYFNAYSQSVALGIEVGEINSMYFEWFGIFSDGLEEEFKISVFNIGIDHYLSEDLVVDFRIGAGLNEDSDDFFTGVGGGYRF